MAKRVSLFVTCVVDQLFPKVGMAAAEVLERLGYQVDFPEDQTCCGQPAFNTGYRREARQVARHFPRKTYFTNGVVRTNLARLPWPDRLRMIVRALGRRIC